jgi:hypothetical protein
MGKANTKATSLKTRVSLKFEYLVREFNNAQSINDIKRVEKRLLDLYLLIKDYRDVNFNSTTRL